MGAPLSGTLQRIAGQRAEPGFRPTQTGGRRPERLTLAGEAILSGKETYGAHLDRLVTARTQMTKALSALREVIRVDDNELAEREARELRRLQNRHWVGPRFASDDGTTPDRTREPYLSGADRLRGWRSPASAAQSAIFVGGQGYQDRRRTETVAREALERSQVLKRDWNRQVDRAAEEGVHVIYTDGFNRLHEELRQASPRTCSWIAELNRR